MVCGKTFRLSGLILATDFRMLRTVSRSRVQASLCQGSSGLILGLVSKLSPAKYNLIGIDIRNIQPPQYSDLPSALPSCKGLGSARRAKTRNVKALGVYQHPFLPFPDPCNLPSLIHGPSASTPRHILLQEYQYNVLDTAPQCIYSNPYAGPSLSIQGSVSWMGLLSCRSLMSTEHSYSLR